MSYISTNGMAITANQLSANMYPNVSATSYIPSYVNTAYYAGGHLQLFAESYFTNRLLTTYKIDDVKNDIGYKLRYETSQWMEDKHNDFNIVSAYNEFKSCIIEHKIDISSSSNVIINDETYHYLGIKYFFTSPQSNFSVDAKLLISDKEFLKLKLSS